MDINLPISIKKTTYMVYKKSKLGLTEFHVKSNCTFTENMGVGATNIVPLPVTITVAPKD